MAYKEQITIGGVPGAGKTTVGKIVAKELGFDFYSMGLLRREIAVETFDLTIDYLNILEEKKIKFSRQKKLNLDEFIEQEIDLDHQESFRRLLKIDTDYLVDEKQRELGMNKEHFVIDGRLGWFFCPRSIKFYLDCDYKIAARRIYNNPRSSERMNRTEEEVYKSLVERMESDTKRYQNKYGKNINCYDKRHFNIIINTTEMGIEEVAEILIHSYKSILKR